MEEFSRGVAHAFDPRVADLRRASRPWNAVRRVVRPFDRADGLAGGAVEEVASNATGATIDADGVPCFCFCCFVTPLLLLSSSSRQSRRRHAIIQKRSLLKRFFEVNFQESGKIPKEKRKKRKRYENPKLTCCTSNPKIQDLFFSFFFCFFSRTRVKNRDKKNQHNTTLSGSREFVSSARNFGARDSTKDDDDAKEESRA